jgi:hypothetical protein
MTIQAFQLNLPQFTERLKMMTTNTLDLLRQETTRLIDLQISTLQDALPPPSYKINRKSRIYNMD